MNREAFPRRVRRAPDLESTTAAERVGEAPLASPGAHVSEGQEDDLVSEFPDGSASALVGSRPRAPESLPVEGSSPG